MNGSVHVIGAGLAGLSAAVRLVSAGVPVFLYEATSQAGGRCRSYHDPALGMVIDNGNHLVLSGNRALLAYADAIGTRDRLIGPGAAEFPFIDLSNGERWTLRANDGLVPWWIFDSQRRVPSIRAADYLPLAPLLLARTDRPVGDLLVCSGPLYERLIGPLLLAALNTEPAHGSALLAAAVLRETLMKGGRTYHPLIARDGLSPVLIEPALRLVAQNGGINRFAHRLRSLEYGASRVTKLDFGGSSVAVRDDEQIVVAVPPQVAASLVPGLQTPTEFRAIVSAHFRQESPHALPPISGVVNGLVEWLFAFPDRLSVTISCADRLLDVPREELAEKIWREVRRIADIAAPLPPWQIVRERRATFAALPKENAKRPGPRTRWSNLVLAGDWTATDLPATIESAVRSGHRAADIALAGLG